MATLSPYSFNLQGGYPQGTMPETYGTVELFPVGNIFDAEDFSSYALGSSPNLIDGFGNFRTASEIATYDGRPTVKDVSALATVEGNAIGFIHSIPSDLVEGDESWARVRVWMPIGSDLSSDPHLKFFRWRTETDLAVNAGYSDIYYDSVNGEFKYIKEGPANWKVISTGVGNPFDVEFGKWIDWEIYTKFSSTVGIVRMWKNGVLMNELLNEQTLTSATDTVKAFYFNTYWNGGVPVQQDWYYDRVDIALNGAGRTDSTELQTDVAGNKFIGVTL